jgi:hypothetical protein
VSSDRNASLGALVRQRRLVVALAAGLVGLAVLATFWRMSEIAACERTGGQWDAGQRACRPASPILIQRDLMRS